MPAPPATTCAAVGWPVTSPGSSSSVGRPTTGTRWPAGRGSTPKLLHDNGLAFRNRRNNLQDAFRGRVLFPIFSENGDAVALGGRILPGSTDPAKYKNSSETPIYTKSKTLYGLNWAKGDIVNANQVIVCEGYTDVIGFHQAGLPRAVATCGTAFTEEHVRLLKRYASRVVLAFDADAAGQGAAERFYEWEEKYQVEVSVAAFPGGKDPGELAQTDPRVWRPRSTGAKPFLGFRLGRVHRRPGAAVARGDRAARRGGDDRRERAPERQHPQALRRPGGRSGRDAGQRPGRDGRARGAPAARERRPAEAAQRAEGERRVRRDRRAGPELGRDRDVARRGALRRRGVPAGRSWRSPSQVATSTSRSTPPTPRRATSSSERPSSTSTRTPPRRPAI